MGLIHTRLKEIKVLIKNAEGKEDLAKALDKLDVQRDRESFIGDEKNLETDKFLLSRIYSHIKEFLMRVEGLLEMRPGINAPYGGPSFEDAKRKATQEVEFAIGDLVDLKKELIKLFDNEWVILKSVEKA